MTPSVLDTTRARRLALARAGLLRPERTGLPRRAAGAGRRARRAALAVIQRFGYLQLDTVSVAGARSHSLVLLSRIEGIDPDMGEELLRPGEPLFEYWGHEASWIPMQLYPFFAFRRHAYRVHPWWGDLLSQHRDVAQGILSRLREEGPLRSADLEGRSGSGWWNLKLSKRIANALWSSGRVAIRERRSFQRVYDLTERVIPEELRRQQVPRRQAFKVLLLRALAGHGWATTGTLSRTWRLSNARRDVNRALHELREEGRVLPCDLLLEDRRQRGWIRPCDLELAERLRRARPRGDRGVLLSPFDPVLWDRQRVQALFGFHQILEIFKPATQRVYGYFCLPVLAGDRLVARCDLKAHRDRGRLEIRALHLETDTDSRARRATRQALERHAASLSLAVDAESALSHA